MLIPLGSAHSSGMFLQAASKMDECTTCGEEVEPEEMFMGDCGEVCDNCYEQEQEDDGLPD